MSEERLKELVRFQFRDLHPLVSLGTASDRYAGWLGQIYSETRYKGRISSRSKRAMDKAKNLRILDIFLLSRAIVGYCLVQS